LVAEAPANNDINQTSLMKQIVMHSNYVHPNWVYFQANLPLRAKSQWEEQTMTCLYMKDKALL